MIIQIRGTSGSGKTWAMRQVMQQLGHWKEHHLPGRRKPAFYTQGRIAILGHYENVCGGCDTFKNYGQLHEALDAALGLERSVILEGLMLSDDVQQTLKMHSAYGGVRAIYLAVNLTDCIARVKERRAERGQGPEFNEEKLKNRQAQIERTKPRLDAAGILTRRAAARQAPGLILGWLGCTLARRQ